VYIIKDKVLLTFLLVFSFGFVWGQTPDLKAKAENGSALPGGDIFCKTDVILFDATDSTGGLGFQFFYNGNPLGAPSAVPTITHTNFNNADTFSVKVTQFADGSGTSSTTTATIGTGGLIKLLSLYGSHTITSSQTICFNGNAAEIIATSTPTPTIFGSVINYQWQVNTGSGWGNVVSPPSGQLASYTPPARSVTVTTSFRRLVSITNSITCDVPDGARISNVHTVLLKSSFTATLTTNPSPAEICNGESISFTAAPVAGANYEFFLDDNSQGAASAVNTFTVTATDNQFVYVKITKDGCEVQSNSVTITVNNLPDPSLTTDGFAGTIICETSPPIVTAIPTAGVTHTFYVNDVLAVDGSVTSNSLDLSKVDLTGSVTVTIDVIVTDLTTGCSKRTSVGDGSSLVLTINRLEGVNNITTSQVSYCNGEDPKIISGSGNPTSSQGASITYKWQERTPAGSIIWQDILNSNSPNFDPPPTIGVGVHEFRRLVTSTLGSATCSPTNDLYYSNTVTLTVGGAAGLSPNVILTTDIGGGGNAVCEGTNIVFTATASPSVNWYEFIIDGASQGFQASPTNTFNSASSTVTFTGSVNVKVKVYTGVSTGTGCINEDEFIVNINSQSNPNSIQYNGTDNLCNGDTPDAPIQGVSNPVSDLSALGGIIQYQWQYNNGGGWLNLSPSNSANFTPGALLATTRYRRISKSSFSGLLCPVDNSLIASNVVTITVDAAPTPSAVLSSGLSSDTLCSTTSSITLDASSSSDGTSYLFFHNGNPAISHPSTSSSLTTTATISDGDVFKVRVFFGC
jgi:hypothetical protein